VTDRFTDLDSDEWMALFTGVQSSWFRLETLQVYDVGYENEEFETFLRTGQLDRDIGPWQQMISTHRHAGRQLRRVHVIEEPLTDYLRYELAAYQHNGRAGEDIRLIPVRHGQWPSDLPQNFDFWLFDDSDVWTMTYDDAGRFLSADRATDTQLVNQCRQWRDVALAHSIPQTDYAVHAA
jgi:hypothetical protein